MEKKLIEKGINNLSKLIEACEDKINAGGNEKSLKSLICGYRKDLDILLLINGELDDVKSAQMVARLGRIGMSCWVEITKEQYLEEEGYLSENYKVKNGKYYKK